MIVGTAALLALAAAQVLLRARRAVAAPTAGASWIWAADSAIDDGPEIFYAVRDLALDFQPTAAEIEILADEEYWLSVNGSSVGAGRWSPEAMLDRYDIAGLLRRGSNRLLVELRSARGVGGLIARLEASGEGEPPVMVGTDESWRIVRRHDRSLLLADGPLPAGRAPRVWGPAPLGRWGGPAAGALLPRLEELRRSRRPWVPRQLRRGLDGAWEPMPSRRGSKPLGPWVVFDGGAAVVGYLSVGFRAGEDPAHGLLWLADESGVDPRLEPYDAVVLAAPGRTWWTDVRPRRFRFAYVLGLDPVTVAEVYPVDPEQAAPLIDEPRGPPGLWDLEPPRLVTAVEHEVWRELQSLPGVGRRQVP